MTGNKRCLPHAENQRELPFACLMKDRKDSLVGGAGIVNRTLSGLWLMRGGALQETCTRYEPASASKAVGESIAETQAAFPELCLARASTFSETGCRRKEFLPAGIIASGMGARSGLPCMCFVSSQAHSRGS
jgi:hypothetical protein